MGRYAEGTGPRKRGSAPSIELQLRRLGSLALGGSVALMGTVWAIACVGLWPTSHATVGAAPADVLACAAAQAKQMGYHVGPDTTHGSLTAEKTRSFQDRGPDVTEYSRQDVLAVSLSAPPSSGGAAVTIEAETISVQESRRGMANVPISASPEVRADAVALLTRCRHAAPNTSLP